MVRGRVQSGVVCRLPPPARTSPREAPGHTGRCGDAPPTWPAKAPRSLPTTGGKPLPGPAATAAKHGPARVSARSQQNGSFGPQIRRRIARGSLPSRFWRWWAERRLRQASAASDVRLRHFSLWCLVTIALHANDCRAEAARQGTPTHPSPWPASLWLLCRTKGASSFLSGARCVADLLRIRCALMSSLAPRPPVASLVKYWRANTTTSDDA